MSIYSRPIFLPSTVSDFAQSAYDEAIPRPSRTSRRRGVIERLQVALDGLDRVAQDEYERFKVQWADSDFPKIDEADANERSQRSLVPSAAVDVLVRSMSPF